MNFKYIKIGVLAAIIAPICGLSQSTTATNNQNVGNPNRFLGFQNNFGVSMRTNNITRMWVNGDIGLTSGFIGINNNNPQFRLHVTGSGQATQQGWTRGILLSNEGALMWEGAPNTNRNYFMGHSSSNPGGNFWQGFATGIGANAPVVYTQTVFVTTNPSNGPDGSTNIRKWLFVHEQNQENRLGVNTLAPFRTAEIRNTNSNNWQLRLTNQNDAWTDFQTRNTGNLNIQPQNGNTGFNMDLNPTHTIDVNGNARIRNTPIAANPQSLIIGGQIGNNANDRELQRLDFTGNANQVLLGNGTWGTVTPNLTGNNGIFVNGGNIQLGAPCNNILGILATQFTESRTVLIRNQNFWMATFNNDTGGVGFGGQPASTPFCGTGNTVEISANNNNVKYGNTDASGLRLTKLTSSSPTIANGVNGVDNTKVLSVDEDGDVVLVEMTPGSSLGNFCGDPQNLLAADYEIPLNDNNVYFTGLGTPTTNAVGIGITCSDPMPGKFNVLQVDSTTVGVNTIAGHFLNSDTANVIGLTFTGVYGEASGLQAPNLRINHYGGDFYATQATNNIAVRGFAEVNPSTMPIPLGANNWGGEFRAFGGGVNNSGVRVSASDASFSNAGIIAQAFSSNALPSITNVAGTFNAQGASGSNTGVLSDAIGGSVAFGVRASANADAGGLSYGIFSSAAPSGVTPPAGPNYAGFFDGDVVRTGSDNFTSDESLKENIEQIENSLAIISQLNPVTFEFNHNVNPQMHLAQGLQYGFIAQDVETVVPELVRDEVFPPIVDSLGNIVTPQVDFKSLNYQAFIPILTKGLQEQQAEIENLNNLVASKDSIINDINDRLTQLENCLGNLLPLLCQINNSAIQQNDGATQSQLIHSLNLELVDGENIVLEQNIPNPFAERTVINYYLPESVGDAKIIFYNQEGRMIDEVKINERGNGRINVFGADLSKGVYSYTLICDGQVIATKKMVKQ
jgi:hypothetical protein